ncbi:restriction endonuclease [Sphingomonas cannabina]|uniref:DNA methyltransferase n=1 Tax=Sphingomonas cannabina TaxID=2899123 RepID=UPI001F42980D|nr:DNA methyltransferase [Sphingomonas cannabina]UIJ45034.1 restriction endonuclease [Sphingomonas cannabina]
MEIANHLFYGDNLDVLREHIPDESVDLIYLDPPFNSNAGYNVLFKAANGAGADASIQAFDDTWTWGDGSKEALLDIAAGTNRALQVMMEAMHAAIGENPLMAYLAMMAVRLVELHRVLKPTGSLYLHCDPTASHYLKLVLDAVFGGENFVNEIIWKRSDSKNDVGQGARHFGRVNDTILFYQKSDRRIWNPQFTALDETYIAKFYRYADPDGRRWKLDNMLGPGGAAKGNPEYEVMGVKRFWRYSRERMEELIAAGRVIQTKPGNVPMYKRYLDESKGTSVTTNWSDISMIRGWSAEKLGYPTQKPRALLERIISASSNPGDVVLDPFCGCGTAVDAAQKLGRRWIGIDVTHIAIGMIEDRMRSAYPGISFETVGVPRDLASAEKLATDDPHQFQQWVCWHVGGYPRDKKGGDKGVDGWFNYLAEGGRIGTGVISVKAGDNIGPTMVRDFGRVMERDRHRFGLFVLKSRPTRGMRDEAASQPMIETEFGRFPALQFVTLPELFDGIQPRLPPLISPMRKAARVEMRTSHQPGAQGSLL